MTPPCQFRSMTAVSMVLALSLYMPTPAAAQDGPDHAEPVVFPTVRYGAPAKLSAGIALQPPFRVLGRHLIGIATLGKGGAKAGLGLGAFGGSLMSGYAVMATITRTTRPVGAPPNQTCVGVEGELMAFNLSVRIGPSVRVTSQAQPGGKFRLNWSVGLGF